MIKLKQMSFYLFITAVAFYLLPLFGTDTGSFIFILLIAIPSICFTLALLYSTKWGFNLSYSITIAALFIPTIFIYYNSSAWIYVFIYTGITLIGSVLGGIVIKQRDLIGTPINYWIAGKGNTESILFIHAAFADHTSFDEQVSYFSKDYQVITLDLIGHGKSTVVKKHDDIDKTSDHIRQLLDVEGIDKVHLVGISIGAVLIQDFANKYPDRISSLCCIGGYDINNFDPSMQKENRGEQMKIMLKALFSIKWFAQSNKLISAVTPEAQEKFYQMNIQFKRRSFRYLAGLSRLVNRHKSMPRNYPILIGCGDKDIPMAIKVAKMWHDREPASKLIIFENSGHLVNMDVPDKFNDSLHKFLLGRL